MSREEVIRQLHASLTLDVLEALTNKGLLRRAQKDLERGEVGSMEMMDSGLVVAVGGNRVTLVETGPALARCTCPASGVCQHILAACLRLMEAPAAEPAGDACAEWVAFTDEELLAAFGVRVLRAAYELNLSNEARIEHDSALTVRFPSLNAEVVAVPGAGFDGIIVKGFHSGKQSQIAAAAMLAVRRKAGKPWEPPPEAAGPAPAHRENVLEATSALLEEAVGAGLARLSPAVTERIGAVAISAQTAELHRLGLLLRSIATQAGDWLNRRPHADLAKIFEDMAMAYALAQGDRRFADGVARENYVDIGALDLTGVAAWPWRTSSGYEGLTVLFWESAHGCWNTWSEARPRTFARGFGAEERFAQMGPWDGADSPAKLARSRFRLAQAKRNRWGRLSSSAQTKAIVTGPADLGILPHSDDWSSLSLAPPLGLRERDPREAFQVLLPAAWERQPFDPIAQSLSWLLRDKNGHLLEMRLAFDDLSKRAIERLEALSEQELASARVLGRCLLVGGRPLIHPLALLQGDRTIPLFFGASAVAPAVSPGSLEDADVEDVEEADEDEDYAAQTECAEIGLAVISTLEWLAESGTRAVNLRAVERLEDLARQIAVVKRFSNLLLAYRTAEDRPGALLRLRWTLSVMLRAAA